MEPGGGGQQPAAGRAAHGTLAEPRRTPCRCYAPRPRAPGAARGRDGGRPGGRSGRDTRARRRREVRPHDVDGVDPAGGHDPERRGDPVQRLAEAASPRTAGRLDRPSRRARAVPGQLPPAVRPPPRARARDRLEEPAATVGPRLPPDVLVPGQLPGGPRPRVRRALHAPGRRRPGPVLRARHDAPPGVRRGAHRRGQRPQPAGPRPDGRQGRAAGGPRAGGTAGGPSDRLVARGARLAGPGDPRGRRGAPRGACARSGRGFGRRPPRGQRARPRGGRPRVPPGDAGPGPLRPRAPPPRRPGRPLPGGFPRRDPPRQAARLPLRADAERVQHGSPLRARLRGADGLRRAGPRPLRPPRREAPPARPRRPPAHARDRAPG